MIKMVVGLPRLEKGPLLRKAYALGADILISANSLSRWHDRDGLREWDGFKTGPLTLADGLHCWLDSAGFVAMKRYRGFPWTIEEYVRLASAYPFFRWASMDYCVEQEVAGDRAEVLDRISRTVRANHGCRALAADYGIVHNFMPVIQGRDPAEYVRCIDRMPMVFEHSIIGVGSMCRRHVHGPQGILEVVSVIDQALTGTDVKLHLFGLKSQGAEAVRGHPRVYSVDSQAYGSAARWEAVKAARVKNNEYVADVMERWVVRQQDRLSKGRFSFQGALFLEPTDKNAQKTPWEMAEQQAREQLRQLVEEGEIEHNQITDRWVFELAGEILSGKTAQNETIEIAA